MSQSFYRAARNAARGLRLREPAQHRRQIAGAHEGLHVLAGLQLVHAIGQAPHALVQVVELLVALVQPPLQIEDADDAGQVDALARQLVDELEPLDV